MGVAKDGDVAAVLAGSISDGLRPGKIDMIAVAVGEEDAVGAEGEDIRFGQSAGPVCVATHDMALAAEIVAVELFTAADVARVDQDIEVFRKIVADGENAGIVAVGVTDDQCQHVFPPDDFMVSPAPGIAA